MPYTGTITTRDPNLVATFEHEDDSTTYILIDDDAQHANPRDNDGNVATLVQTSQYRTAIDTPDVELDYARDRASTTVFERWLRIYRPDVLLYVDYWQAGTDSFGWGYVTRAHWIEAMGGDYTGEVTPQEAFDAEVDVYRQWAEGEVYGYIHVEADGTEDSVWGFLGYDSLEEIVAQASDSPITERTDT